MKLKFMLYILVFLLIVGFVEAGTNLKISNARCLEEGRISITATTKNTEPTNLKNTTVRIFNKKIGWFNSYGSWNKDEIKRTSTHDKTAVYTSTFGILTIPGAYTAFVYYENCTYPPCEDQYTMIRCPGFIYSCNLAELEIVKAFQKNDEMWIQFKGININQYEKLDVEKAIRISIDSNSRTMYNKAYAGNMQLDPKSEDEYTLKIPLGVGEEVYNIGLSIGQCYDDKLQANPTTITYEIKKPVDVSKIQKLKEIVDPQSQVKPVDNKTEKKKENISGETIIQPVKTRMRHTGLSTPLIILIIVVWLVILGIIAALLFVQYRNR